MALLSLSCGTCIQPNFRDHEWISKIFEPGFQNQLKYKGKMMTLKDFKWQEFQILQTFQVQYLLEGYSLLPKEFPKKWVLRLQQLMQASLNHY